MSIDMYLYKNCHSIATYIMVMLEYFFMVEQFSDFVNKNNVYSDLIGFLNYFPQFKNPYFRLLLLFLAIFSAVLLVNIFVVACNYILKSYLRYLGKGNNKIFSAPITKS